MHFLLRIFSVVFVGMMYVGCNSSSMHNDSAVFRYNEPAGVSSLDPAFARAQSNIWICHQLFSTLVELDAQLDVIPGLAKEWLISDSGRSYRFTLHSEVAFHPHPSFEDVRILTAEDVVYSLYRLKDPALSSPGAWTMQWVDSIYAVNDSVVSIDLYEPFSPFLKLLSMKYTSIVPKEAVEYDDIPFAKYPTGTGPFYLKRWVPGDRLILRRYHNYHCDGFKGNIESVVVRFINDKLSAFLSFLKGDLDFISGLDVSYRDDIVNEHGHLREKHRSRMRLETTAYLNTEYLAFNTEKLANDNSPFSDSRIRKAIHLAIDKEQLVRYLMRGMAIPANIGMTPPSLRNAPQQLIEHDQAQARELLSQAGYKNGDGLPPITLHTNPGYQDMAEFIQSQLIQIGIRVSVDVSPPATLRQQIATGKVNWFRASWIADYPDVENYMLLFSSAFIPPNGPNYSRFSDAQTDSLYHTLSRMQPSPQRDSLHALMETKIAEQSPVIPLFYDQVIRIINKDISGFPINSLNLLEIRDLKKH